MQQNTDDLNAGVVMPGCRHTRPKFSDNFRSASHTSVNHNLTRRESRAPLLTLPQSRAVPLTRPPARGIVSQLRCPALALSCCVLRAPHAPLNACWLTGECSVGPRSPRRWRGALDNSAKEKPFQPHTSSQAAPGKRGGSRRKVTICLTE